MIRIVDMLAVEVLDDLASAYAMSGKTNEAKNLLADLTDLSKRQYVQPSYIAMLYAGLGEKDPAFKMARKNLRE